MSEVSGEGFFGRLFGGKRRRKEAAGREALTTELATTEQRLTDLNQQANVPDWSHPNDALLAEQLTARQNEIRKQLGIPEQGGPLSASSPENTQPTPSLIKPEPSLRPIVPPSGKAK